MCIRDSLYVAGYTSEQLDRFDIANSLWLTSIDLGDRITALALAGDTILAGTVDDGVFLIENGTIRANVPPSSTSSPDAADNYVADIAATGDCGDSTGCNIIVVQPNGVYRIDADATAIGSATLLKSGAVSYTHLTLPTKA